MLRRRLKLIVFSLALVAALAVPMQVTSAAHFHRAPPCAGTPAPC